MTPEEIVNEIESIAEQQLEHSDLWDALEKLQMKLLNDPTGEKLEAIQAQRLVEYWRNHKPSQSRLIAPSEVAKDLAEVFKKHATRY